MDTIDRRPDQATQSSGLLRALKGLDRGMSAVERLILIISTVVMVAIILADIFSRNILAKSIFWAQELARYMMVLGVFFGCSVCVRQKAHLGIDILLEHVKGKLKLALEIVIAVSSIIGFIILAGLQFRFAVKAIAVNQTTPTLYIQYGYLYAAIGVAMVFSAIRAVMVFLDSHVFHGSLIK